MCKRVALDEAACARAIVEKSIPVRPVHQRAAVAVG
jgi:hypothetical protein